jgi:hypothetical protein
MELLIVLSFLHAIVSWSYQKIKLKELSTVAFHYMHIFVQTGVMYVRRQLIIGKCQQCNALL